MQTIQVQNLYHSLYLEAQYTLNKNEKDAQGNLSTQLVLETAIKHPANAHR